MKVDSNVITGGYLVKNIIVDPLFLVNGSFVTFDLVSSHYAGLFLSSFGNDDNSDEMVGYPSGGGGGAGTPGAPGVNGLPGVRGADGNDGEDGERGFPGLQGAKGVQGGIGPQGVATYLEAEQGNEGDQGPPGVIGLQGVAGATGSQGPQGVATFLESEPGQDGDPGPPGRAGASGNNGTTGAQGPIGPAVFLDAEPGEQGEMGPPGLPALSNLVYYNFNTADVTATGVDTYLTGSSINIPLSKLKAGGTFKWKFGITKTAAGLATPIWRVRIGTAGSTADAAILTFTGLVQTAAIDTYWLEIVALVRSIGAAGILVGILHGRPRLSGFPLACLQVTSAGFDTTVANLIAGVSVNPGLNGVWTHQIVSVELVNN